VFGERFAAHLLTFGESFLAHLLLFMEERAPSGGVLCGAESFPAHLLTFLKSPSTVELPFPECGAARAQLRLTRFALLLFRLAFRLGGLLARCARCGYFRGGFRGACPGDARAEHQRRREHDRSARAEVPQNSRHVRSLRRGCAHQRRALRAQRDGAEEPSRETHARHESQISVLAMLARTSPTSLGQPSKIRRGLVWNV
jgi:hypothetical protein